MYEYYYQLKNKVKKKTKYFYQKIKFTLFNSKSTDNSDQINWFFNQSYHIDFRYANIHLFYSQNNKNKIVDILNKYYGKIIPDTISEANKICRNSFFIFGRQYNYKANLEWHKDLISGYIWPLKFNQDIKVINTKDDSDIKFPWELNRFFFGPILGQAYLFTGNEKYPNKFNELVRSWIKSNPYNAGINWNCSMEVSIRAINLIWTYCFLSASKCIDEGFRRSFMQLLSRHANFIYSNLENLSNPKGNHYLTNLVGLIYISLFLIKDKKSTQWLSFAIREINSLVLKEVHDDGTSNESSTSYHRLITELYLHSLILLQKYQNSSNSNQRINDLITHKIMNKSILKKIELMCEFTMTYTQSNGLSPQIGDNDSGRLIQFRYNDIEVNDHQHLLALAGEIFNRDDFRKIGQKSYEEAIWLFQGDISIPDSYEYNQSSRRFEKFGLYIMKSGENSLCIKCSNLGLAGKGTHDHNDNLSFTLTSAGETFLCDPGTFTYTRDFKMRNLFRSTNYHNSLFINNLEQNKFDLKDPFRLIPQVNVSEILWESTNDYDVFKGRLEYFSEEKPIIHTRKIKFYKKDHAWHILDDISGNINRYHDLIWNFHTLPDAQIELQNDCFIIQKNNIYLKIRIESDSSYTIKKSNYWYSPGYSVKVVAKKAQIFINCKLPLGLKLFIHRL